MEAYKREWPVYTYEPKGRTNEGREFGGRWELHSIVMAESRSEACAKARVCDPAGRRWKLGTGRAPVMSLGHYGQPVYPIYGTGVRFADSLPAGKGC